ncbi:type-F conjugative transfer system pilin assembly protein TrbC [Salmonella enterica subsp. enterica serovar Richmond]|nr:type-F conjugative transfer system pilin assembly protein TrbC [Salmonella enterica subsp. enterica serovar Richmond]EBY6939029.1 type-F conjugative transfer system pilin assembly protein TrbC [Salmonella enterica subsp. enterica serovar Newport]EBZ2757956.1 type-F conjugative transfer system pilin assembly protein TrbC [Salmonella enterica subsp. enterica serovar Pomona]ECB7316527.1 type-F conjugative transfer system pilin assembly protein TrbC [Salmonella enterica subsp. enterica serovar Tr
MKNNVNTLLITGALLCNILPVMAQADSRSDSAQFIESLRDKSDVQRYQAPPPAFLQPPRQSARGNILAQGLLQQQRETSQRTKKQARALYFVSFSIPEEGLIRMLPEARELNIPAVVNGLIENDMRKTAEAVFRITREKNTGGVQIDPTQFARFGITSVPALVVTCGESTYDIVRGNIRLRQALERVASEGDCASTAKAILAENAA